jgi:hypothetical protein
MKSIVVECSWRLIIKIIDNNWANAVLDLIEEVGL